LRHARAGGEPAKAVRKSSFHEDGMTSLGPIGQISMNVHDIERATAFYKDVLNVKLLFRAGQLSFFDCGGVRLMLSPPETSEFDHPGSVLYFRVADIKATHQELAGRGVGFVGEPHLIARMPDHELWMAFFKDSEGNTLALMSEIRN
jgi:methylmalonyl-CoA/ethylmalonyl-CoA epimerase